MLDLQALSANDGTHLVMGDQKTDGWTKLAHARIHITSKKFPERFLHDPLRFFAQKKENRKKTPKFMNRGNRKKYGITYGELRW